LRALEKTTPLKRGKLLLRENIKKERFDVGESTQLTSGGVGDDGEEG